MILYESKNNADENQDNQDNYQQNEPLTSVGIICIKLDKSI
jgi:hypothetical protein